MNKFKNINTGRAGEKVAQDYVVGLGYVVLDTNWHFSRNSEIDIIAKDKDTLVFIEVKTRSTLGFGHPLEAIDAKKIKKIYMAGLAYLGQTKEKYKNYRIDAVSIVDLRNPQIEHIKNIGFS